MKRIWTNPIEAGREIAGALGVWIAGEQLPAVTIQHKSTPADLARHTGYFFKSLAQIRRFYDGNIIVLHLDGRYTRPEMIRAFEEHNRQAADPRLHFLHTDELLTPQDYYPIDGHIRASGHAKIADALTALIRGKQLLSR